MVVSRRRRQREDDDARDPDGVNSATTSGSSSIEDAAELRLGESARRLPREPVRRTWRAVARWSVRDLVRNALRMRPDRIIVGEVRGGRGARHAAGDEHRPRGIALDGARQLRPSRSVAPRDDGDDVRRGSARGARPRTGGGGARHRRASSPGSETAGDSSGRSPRSKGRAKARRSSSRCSASSLGPVRERSRRPVTYPRWSTRCGRAENRCRTHCSTSGSTAEPARHRRPSARRLLYRCGHKPGVVRRSAIGSGSSPRRPPERRGCAGTTSSCSARRRSLDGPWRGCRVCDRTRDRRRRAHGQTTTRAGRLTRHGRGTVRGCRRRPGGGGPVGASLTQAVRYATTEAAPPVRDDLTRIVAQLDTGIALEQALRSWPDVRPSANVDRRWRAGAPPPQRRRSAGRARPGRGRDQGSASASRARSAR